MWWMCVGGWLVQGDGETQSESEDVPIMGMAPGLFVTGCVLCMLCEGDFVAVSRPPDQRYS